MVQKQSQQESLCSIIFRQFADFPGYTTVLPAYFSLPCAGVPPHHRCPVFLAVRQALGSRADPTYNMHK